MTKDSKKQIIIKGAKEHNLQNIDLAIPRDEFIVITGLSGSGKSSLALKDSADMLNLSQLMQDNF
mgnify:CR=1 FL=1